MSDIEQRYLIHAPIEKVWNVFTDSEKIGDWGVGPAKMKDEVGFDFSLWGGDIYGKNLEVDKPADGKAKIVQEWYGGEWDRPSIVTIRLNSDEKTTEVLLEHKDVPEEELDELANGWKEYYFDAIKKLLEKGSR